MTGMSRAEWMGVLGALALLTACEGGPEGNGKRGELYFVRDTRDVAAGLQVEVTLRSIRRWPEYADITTADRTDSWEFHDAQVEVEAPAGLAFKVSKSAVYDHRYTLQARCEAAPGLPHEVTVRVRGADGKVRYEDAFDVTCAEPDGLELTTYDPRTGAIAPFTGGRYFVGGSLELRATLTAGGRSLQSQGLVLEDARGVLRQAAAQDSTYLPVTFDVVAGEAAPELRYRGVRYEVALEPVAGPWTLSLGEWQGAPGREYAERTLTAQARGADGEVLQGLGTACTWTLNGVESHPGVPQGNVLYWYANKPQQTCVSAKGQRACREDP